MPKKSSLDASLSGSIDLFAVGLHSQSRASIAGKGRILLALLFLLGLGLTPVRAARPIGIDISDYQSSSINWSTLKNTYGVSFAWAKATEGGSSSGGGNFFSYAANAKAAGVYIGAYHYARYDLNGGASGATS